jgi:hypothetical protein
MSPTIRFVYTAILGFTVGALVWVCRTIDGQVAAMQALSSSFAGTVVGKAGPVQGGFMSGGEPPLDFTRTVHVRTERTAAQARTWLRLQEPIALAFPDETPFEDVLSYIKSASAQKMRSPIPIYVDPVGIQTAEKTMQSTVMIDLGDVPLEVSMRLMLKQLGLTYSVSKEGLVVITSEMTDDSEHDAETLILDHLTSLRSEIAALRWEVAVLRTGSVPIRSGGMGGGMGGTMGSLCVF